MAMPLFLCVVGFVCATAIAVVGWTAPVPTRLRDVVRAIVVLTVWVGLTSMPVALGLVSPDHAFPGVPVQMSLILVAAIGLALSPLGARLAHGLPLGVLVGFHGFRLPLEIVLYLWGQEGTAPVQLTWEGSNPDVLTGIVALVLAPFAHRRGVAWVFSVVGIGLLVNVLRVVVLSIPGAPWMAFDEPLLLPFQLPHLWIATVCVAAAVAGHAVLLRRLLSEPVRPDLHGPG